MSNSASGFLAKIGSSLVALCIVSSQPGSGATQADECDPTTPPPVTTTVTTDGHPWHG